MFKKFIFCGLFLLYGTSHAISETIGKLFKIVSHIPRHLCSRISQLNNIQKITLSQIGLGTGIVTTYNYMHTLAKRKSPIPYYTVNLIWINHKLNPEQQLIHPDEEFLKKSVFTWADITSQRGRIVFWYDEKTTTLSSVIKTQLEIDAYNREHKHNGHVTLKNIRQLDEVKKHPTVFSPEYPVYFRVDLLKIITAIEMLTKKQCRYFIHSDLDIKKPLTLTRIFTQEHLALLKQYGIVFGSARGENDEAENQFHMMQNDPDLMKALQHCIINLNIARAYNAENKKNLGETVFSSYRPMLYYLYTLKKWGTLYNHATHSYYNAEQDGLKPFGINNRGSGCLSFVSNDVNPTLHETNGYWAPVTHTSQFPRCSLHYCWL